MNFIMTYFVYRSRLFWSEMQQNVVKNFNQIQSHPRAQNFPTPSLD